MYHLGYDYFTEPENSCIEIKCKVCNTICEYEKVFGPRNSIEAMAGHAEDYNRYICPNANFNWHQQAYNLLIYMEACPSPTLKNLMKLDLELLLGNKR